MAEPFQPGGPPYSNTYSNTSLGDPFRYSKYSGTDPPSAQAPPRKLTFLDIRQVDQSSPDTSTSSSTSPLTYKSVSTPTSSPEDPINLVRAPSVTFNAGGRPGISRKQRFKAAIGSLHAGKLGPTDLMLYVLDPNNEDSHRFGRALYGEDSKLHSLLDRIVDSPDGRAYFVRWLQGRDFDIIGQLISAEMDRVKKSLAMRVPDLTTDFIKTWTLESAVGTIVRRDAPTLRTLLMKAAQTELAESKNKVKHPDTLCDIIIAQLVNSRSSHSSSFQIIFSLFLWSTGCQRQTIDALSRCGLSVSFDSILSLISGLGLRCLDLAADIAGGPHVLCWDNINISLSTFVEQRSDAPAKVQSGTFALLYRLPHADPSQMHLAPILARAQTAPDLSFAHIRPTQLQLASTLFQLKVIVVQILISCAPEFECYAHCPELQHRSRRPTPLTKTETFPLRVTTINEAR